MASETIRLPDDKALATRLLPELAEMVIVIYGKQAVVVGAGELAQS